MMEAVALVCLKEETTWGILLLLNYLKKYFDYSRVYKLISIFAMLNYKKKKSVSIPIQIGGLHAITLMGECKHFIGGCTYSMVG